MNNILQKFVNYCKNRKAGKIIGILLLIFSIRGWYLSFFDSEIAFLPSSFSSIIISSLLLSDKLYALVGRGTVIAFGVGSIFISGNAYTDHKHSAYDFSDVAPTIVKLTLSLIGIYFFNYLYFSWKEGRKENKGNRKTNRKI